MLAYSFFLVSRSSLSAFAVYKAMGAIQPKSRLEFEAVANCRYLFVISESRFLIPSLE